MGNYQLGRGETKEAVASYQAALKLDPQAIMAMVNIFHRLCPDGRERQGGEVAAEGAQAGA